jgi:hypothetical protein
MAWNDPEHGRCARCGAYFPEEEPHGTTTQDRNAAIDEDDSMDEFGRFRKKAATSKKIVAQPEWPPRFETNGSAFVFDARSGMFYQAESDFFYDPNSKLYYGNKQGAYYRYTQDSNTNIPFEQVQKITHSENASTNLEPALEMLHPVAKKGISIHLKTKSLGGSKKKEKLATDASRTPFPAASTGVQQKHVPTLPRQHEQHEANIDKWSDRQVEKRDQEEGTGKNSERTVIQRTAKGEPICVLCQRKFPTVEKLLYHERVSKLHQENLAQKKEHFGEAPQRRATARTCSGSSDLASSSYIDRAEQRRIMHGPDTLPVMTSFAPASIPTKPDMAAAAPVDPQESLGESNIGNQLLQKMGWNVGETVGRQDRSECATTSESLLKDWERIEALAATSKGGQSSSNNKAGLGA